MDALWKESLQPTNIELSSFDVPLHKLHSILGHSVVSFGNASWGASQADLQLSLKDSAVGPGSDIAYTMDTPWIMDQYNVTLRSKTCRFFTCPRQRLFEGRSILCHNGHLSGELFIFLCTADLQLFRSPSTSRTVHCDTGQ